MSMSDEQRALLGAMHRGGRLRPDTVLAAAAPTDSPLHNLFEWDDSIAGHRYRMEQARAVVVRITAQSVASSPAPISLRIREYVRDPDLPPGEQGYIQVAVLRTKEQSAVLATHAEFDRIAALTARARDLTDRLGTRPLLENLLAEMVSGRKKGAGKAA